MATTVLLVEDHRLVREALREALTLFPDIQIVGETGDADMALEHAVRLSPDIIVLDIRLPRRSGIEVLGDLRDAGCHAKVIVLSAYFDKYLVSEMLRAGACAYLTKSESVKALVRAIGSAMAGQSYLSPEVSSMLVAGVREGDAADGSRLGRREREVLRLVAEGRRSAEIADTMCISVATVEVHRRNIMRKLELRTVAELTRYAVREGLVAL